MDEITAMLQSWRHHETGSTAELMRSVYEDLRHIAIRRLATERRDHTLDPEALVHEAFFRLLEQRGLYWRDRRHFFILASTMMRRVLLNHARDRRCIKRGAGVALLSLDHAQSASDRPADEWSDLDVALRSLAHYDRRLAAVTRLRFFGGFSNLEIAQELGISIPTVLRRWRVARAWLYRYLSEPR